MISEANLDVRTITMGISLMDCADADIGAFRRKIYDKITRKAERLVQVGDDIAREYGVPVVNKRISVTPIAIAASGCQAGDYVDVARTMDRAAETTGVNFIGGFSALAHKGMTPEDRKLLDSIPSALAETERVCSSVSVASTRSGITMDAVNLAARIVRDAAELTSSRDSIGCAKFVVFCNAVEDNPFMAGA
ncbi:MAG: DUF711 family protein, partial [Synergistaceae bacterium]|nr:DUF711 family protein [Synergistaceae bacterium]